MGRITQPFNASDEAVSPVIGVILMVAITVVLAAAVFLMITEIGPDAEPTPSLAMQRYGDGAYRVVSADPGLLWSEFTVTGCTDYPTDNGVFAGDVISGCDQNATIAWGNTLIWSA